MQKLKSVLITGITGYIGGSIALALIDKGYRVFGIYRKQEDKLRILSEGISPVYCDLNDKNLTPLKAAIKACDIVIHAAECDSIVIAALLIKTLRGTGKTLIYTSGAGYLANHRQQIATLLHIHEDNPVRTSNVFPNRIRINNAILRSAAFGIHSIVMVPGMVYGKGHFINIKSKQLPALEQAAHALQSGVYIDSGKNCWSHVHIDDLVDLYLLALAKAKRGSLFYIENGETSFYEIGTAIHQRLGFNGTATSLTLLEASERWGSMMAKIGLSSNCRINADKARQMLGWQPHHNSILSYIFEEI